MSLLATNSHKVTASRSTWSNSSPTRSSSSCPLPNFPCPSSYGYIPTQSLLSTSLILRRTNALSTMRKSNTKATSSWSTSWHKSWVANSRFSPSSSHVRSSSSNTSLRSSTISINTSITATSPRISSSKYYSTWEAGILLREQRPLTRLSIFSHLTYQESLSRSADGSSQNSQGGNLLLIWTPSSWGETSDCLSSTTSPSRW